jgi:hypothetical protein
MIIFTLEEYNMREILGIREWKLISSALTHCQVEVKYLKRETHGIYNRKLKEERF